MILKTHEVQCPYCGQMIELDVEHLPEEQSLIEDCTVCCRPIQYTITPNEEEEDVEIFAERSE